MLLSVAVVLSMFAGSVSADAWNRINNGEGSKSLDATPPPGGGLGLDGGGSGIGGLGSNGYLIIAIIGIVIVVAVLLIIKFVLPKIRQSK